MAGTSEQVSVAEHDRWLWRPAVMLLFGAFCLAELCGLPGTVSFILILLVGVGWPAPALILLFPAGLYAVRGKVRKATSVLFAALLPILLWRPICWMADCAHIALTVGLGVGEIGSGSAAKTDRFTTYDWSVGLAGGPDTFLIYDATDEIALPLALHKSPIATENGFGEDCAGRVSHLIGHYYRCTF